MNFMRREDWNHILFIIVTVLGYVGCLLVMVLFYENTGKEYEIIQVIFISGCVYTVLNVLVHITIRYLIVRRKND